VMILELLQSEPVGFKVFTYIGNFINETMSQHITV